MKKSIAWTFFKILAKSYETPILQASEIHGTSKHCLSQYIENFFEHKFGSSIPIFNETHFWSPRGILKGSFDLLIFSHKIFIQVSFEDTIHFIHYVLADDKTLR